MANYKLTNADKFYIEKNPDISASKLAKDIGCNSSTVQKHRDKYLKDKLSNSKSKREVLEVREEIQLSEQLETQAKLGRDSGHEKTEHSVSSSKTASQIADAIFQGVDRTPNPDYIRSTTPDQIQKNMENWRKSKGIE